MYTGVSVCECVCVYLCVCVFHELKYEGCYILPTSPPPPYPTPNPTSLSLSLSLSHPHPHPSPQPLSHHRKASHAPTGMDLRVKAFRFRV
jgi:hypothetical protein